MKVRVCVCAHPQILLRFAVFWENLSKHASGETLILLPRCLLTTLQATSGMVIMGRRDTSQAKSGGLMGEEERKKRQHEGSQKRREKKGSNGGGKARIDGEVFMENICKKQGAGKSTW